MNYEFKKLADVEALPEVPEVATVFAEVNGEVKRIPSSGLGGVVKTAIIKDSRYDDAVASMMNPVEPSVAVADAVEPEYSFSCLNMTFEEAYETMAAGEPLDAKVMMVYNGPGVISAQAVGFGGVAIFGMPAIALSTSLNGDSIHLFWTADGISTKYPGGVS